MHSATTLTSLPLPTSSSCSFTRSSKYSLATQIQLKTSNQNPRRPFPTSLKCTQVPLHSKPYNPRNPIETANNVTQKLQFLVTEFMSLTEPIDRVKRLLHYATLLPFFDEPARSQENRVTGCTAQVWLEVIMDLEGLMRFRVDSDSEITKGFCSCLIWLLDGAAPEEVMAVKAEDLAEMNVGILPSNSRVNTWHTVLISMQKRTKSLVAERFAEPLPPLEPFPCLIAASGDIRAQGSFKEAKV